MSHTLETLAQARAAFVAATEASEAAHASQTKLLTRKAEAEAAAAAALSDFRANKIDQATAALLKASNDADAADLGVLIDRGAAVLLGLNSELERARAKAAQAETAARNEELTIMAKELDAQIQHLEATLLSAIAERARVFKALNPRSNGSTFTYFRPSQALDMLVKQHIAPSA